MALPVLNVTPGAGATINTLPNAPAIVDNSVSVALATDHAPLPISATTLPLPAGAATSALQGAANVSLAALVAATGSNSMQQTGGTVGLVAGTSVVGKFGIDQAVPGTTNAVVVTGGAIALLDRSGYIRGAVGSATPQAAGTSGWNVGDTLTMPAGANVVTPAVLQVASTKVAAAPTIVSGGSGGANGAVTLIGTTGTGTRFQATGTIAGGILTGVTALTVPGNYTVNPANLTAEPVTGGGLTGATLNIAMAISTLIVTTPGVYSAPVNNPVTSVSTSGSGAGATVNLASFTPLSTPFVGVNANRQYIAFRNESASSNLALAIGATASFGAVGAATFGPNGDGFEWSGVRVPSNQMSLIGQVAFQQFTGWEG